MEQKDRHIKGGKKEVSDGDIHLTGGKKEVSDGDIHLTGGEEMFKRSDIILSISRTSDNGNGRIKIIRNKFTPAKHESDGN